MVSFSKGKKLSAGKIRRGVLQTPPRGRDTSEVGRVPCKCSAKPEDLSQKAPWGPKGCREGCLCSLFKYTYVYIHIHTHIYICICIYIRRKNSSKRSKWVFIQKSRVLNHQNNLEMFLSKSILDVYFSVSINHCKYSQI